MNDFYRKFGSIDSNLFRSNSNGCWPNRFRCMIFGHRWISLGYGKECEGCKAFERFPQKIKFRKYADPRKHA